MKSKTLIRSALVAVLLYLVRTGIFFIARFFYQQPADRMTGFNQSHNIMVVNYADWVFTLIIAGVWVFLYLRDRRSGYGHLVGLIVPVLGIFTLISMTQRIVTALFSTELPGKPAANIAWIVMMTPVSFIYTAVLTGFMAAAVIAVINRRRSQGQQPSEEGGAPPAKS